MAELKKYKRMKRWRHVQTMTAWELTELLNNCADSCQAAREGSSYCPETSCEGCITKWLDEDIVVEVKAKGLRAMWEKMRREKT